ncbi:MAG: HPr kinase/phosphatase C-terminal domain-containing protein [Phenylobacterium sp.]|uniref:HPr kinase/phosphorylase n=1 Tax=Phenylobacterium sp. TaxID=1871053 RepID=UPI00271E2EB6|nr:HPr kinase/phosphatase C-terminal domain-containing protein [Phenylobacterium sp.]MDO8910822.1 HPr kinase/phosphatase C-terminal domain-containing protein [Phenylobacterium sp.]MDZ4061304.1 HPr kinase/phosphatase C-terminal domain-containing protein [Brevundimonas sp.]
MSIAQPLHATAMAQWKPGTGWRAILISGPSGAGKSDLALRLIGRGWRLVADDYVHVFASGEGLYVTAPDTIRGRIEARGLGIIGACVQGVVRLVLAVDLVEAAPERLPDPEMRNLGGRSVPLLRLSGFEASAVEKVAAAIAPL